MEDNKKSSFENPRFSRNIKLLFKEQSNFNYSKNKLNLKIKSIITKDKVLNERKILNFNYNQIFHNFKNNMKKFDESQLKRKKLYTTLTEENKKFNKQYLKNYSPDIKIKNTLQQKMQSKTCQKYKVENNLVDEKNIFENDPLIISNASIRRIFMESDFNDNNDKHEELTDKAITYMNKVENDIQQNSVLNRIKEKISSKKGKNKDNKFSLTKDNFFSSIENNIYNNLGFNKNKKKLRNKLILNNHKKYARDIKKYNNNLKEMISKLSKTNNNFKFRKRHLSLEIQDSGDNSIPKRNYSNNKFLGKRNTIYNIYNTDNYNNYNNNKYFSSKSNNLVKNNFLNLTSERNKKKKEDKYSSQIKSLYDGLDRIKTTIKNYEKKNDSKLKNLYPIFSSSQEKKFKQNKMENQTLLKLDRELVNIINSFEN